MIMLQPRLRSAITGQTFGARGDSCSCDPCDCNPCNCGDSLIPNYPDWRVSGYFVKNGMFAQQQLSKHIILSLAQPEHQGSQEGWQEVLLVESNTPLELVHTLLSLFEHELDSMPAEIEAHHQIKRAVYRAPMEYLTTKKGPHLRVAFHPDLTNLVRDSSIQQAAREWSYDGPMALRGFFSLASE
jgi:hypothetical protein